MDNIYENIERYNPNLKYKILTVFDDTITNTFSNKKPNISPFFTTQSLFVVPKKY